MNFNNINSKHLSKKDFEDGRKSWRAILLKILKFSALLLVPALMVLILDRVRYGLLHKDNQNFINEVIDGNGKLPAEIDNHFLLLDLFNRAELGLYILVIIFSVFLLMPKSLLKSFALSMPVCFAGVVIGHAASRTTAMREEFVQTYFIAIIASFTIVIIVNYFKKEK